MTAALVALALASSLAVPAHDRVTVRHGELAATIEWRTEDDPPEASIYVRWMRVTIRRHGRVALRRFVPRSGWGPVVGRPVARQFAEWTRLDGDAEPELVLSLYGYGAHCCAITVVYGLTDGRYRSAYRTWDNYAEPMLRDVDGDGSREFDAANGRFGYSQRYPQSIFPEQVWRWRNGRLVDATRSYPGLVAARARQHWRDFVRPSDGPRWWRTPHLDAWLAEMHLLGRGREGWRIARRVAREGRLGPNGDRYLRGLRRELREHGYV